MKEIKKQMYVMIWVEEENKWYYVKSDFDETQFKNGYIDYWIYVEDGIIKQDTWMRTNEGKQFSKCYDVNNWK